MSSSHTDTVVKNGEQVSEQFDEYQDGTDTIPKKNE